MSAPAAPVLTPGACAPWITKAQVRECCAAGETLTDDQIDRAITFATNWLFRRSGRQYPGICSRVVRPCAGDNCGCAGSGWIGAWSWSLLDWIPPAVPERINAEWFNVGLCSGSCNLFCVTLPAPISAVTSVKVDGVVLTADQWRVFDYRQLCRQDGGQWPCTQDFTKPDTEPGTWSIAYDYGSGPGPDGEIIAAMYACELARSLCPTASSCLPDGIQKLVREGVEIEFLTLAQLAEATGISLVDRWLESVNPEKLPRRSTITRLDGPARPRGY